MPINKETIISVYDDKLTLMQWLKTINKALEDAVLTGVEITKKGNATLSFKFTFEDGTYLETNDLVLQQGESVENAYIQNGHLYLTLTNGTNLDAGNVKPVSNFSIDDNQHLIVNYGDGTSQDLGAIFNGNVNISGTLNATKVTGDEIIENMAGYSFTATGASNILKEINYAGVVKNGNKVTFVMAGVLKKLSTFVGPNEYIGTFNFPYDIGAKLYPNSLGQLDNKIVNVFAGNESSLNLYSICGKAGNTGFNVRFYGLTALTQDTEYGFRYEVTFLLSDNLAQ